MTLFSASFSTLPDETLREIAAFVAGSSVQDPHHADGDDWSEVYADLCALSLASKRTEAASTPFLYQAVVLKPPVPLHFTMRRGPTPTERDDFDPSIHKFAALVHRNPELLRHVQSLIVNFHPVKSAYGEILHTDKQARKTRLRDSERVLRSALAQMPGLRSASVVPYVSTSMLVKDVPLLRGLHPSARPTSFRYLAFEAGPLLLDEQPCLSALERLGINIDGARYYDPVVPRMTLHLPRTLTQLELFSEYTDDAEEFELDLASSVPNLKRVEIRGRSFGASCLEPFFPVQGSCITTLVLLCTDLAFAADQHDPEDILDQASRKDDEYYVRIENVFPVASRCPNLVTLELYDVHLPYVTTKVREYPSLKTIVLHRDLSFDKYYVEARHDRLDNPRLSPVSETVPPGDTLEWQVLRAIGATLKPERLPKLETIQYAQKGLTWEEIFYDQWMLGDWGDPGVTAQGKLDEYGWYFLDGTGAPWPDGDFPPHHSN